MSRQNEHLKRLSRHRDGLTIILLLALFIILSLLYQPALSWQPALSGEPGDVLYVATFDAFEDEWQQYDGRLQAQIIDGQMRLIVGDAGRLPFSVARYPFADFDARMTIQAIDQALDNAYGMIFRLQQAKRQDCSYPGAILCDLAKFSGWFDLLLSRIFGASDAIESTKYYMFMISNDGFYSVRRSSDEGARFLSAWIPSPIIRQGNGEVNEIRVIARGNRFQFFINGERVPVCVPDDPQGESTYFGGECVEGQMVDMLVDDAIESGQIGVIAETFASSGLVVEFDDFVVTSPDEELLPGDGL